MTIQEIHEKKDTIQNWRVNFFMGVIGVAFLIFIGRLFFIQIIEGEKYQAQAEENRISEVSVATQRGVIYDRNGIVLAQNTASYNIAITPANLPDDEAEKQAIYREISDLTGLPVHKGDIEVDPLINCGTNLGISEMIEIGLSYQPYNSVLVQCGVDVELALIIEERAIDMPGVSIETEPMREYPIGESVSSLIGFLGPIPEAQEDLYVDEGFVANRDKVGYAGLELYFDEELRGVPGKRVVEVDVGGQVTRDIEQQVAPEPGENIVLTIDVRFQEAVYEILKDEIKLWNDWLGKTEYTSGVVVAMNPKTGEILAMVNWPTYENNRMASFIPAYYYEQLSQDSTKPLVNHAVGSEVPAGSVFKLVTAIGSLNEGVITPDTIVETPGVLVVDQKFYEGESSNLTIEYVDWNRAGFGSLNVVGGIQNSSNVFFYKVGGGFEDEIPEGLGICRLGEYARALGYGDYTGIELLEDGDGLIPDPTWKRINQGENWATGDTYLASVGQGYIIVTPLQVVMSASTIANDGKLMQPTLLYQIQDSEGNVIEDFSPEMKWDITDPETPMITKFENPAGIGSCKALVDEAGNEVKVSVESKYIDVVQQGMRMAVLEGTLADIFENSNISAAGKTGTAEYCDDVASSLGKCNYGAWPSHAWTLSYAPYEDPEIAVVAFVYNGTEGSTVAGPIVEKVLRTYFNLKEIDSNTGN